MAIQNIVSILLFYRKVETHLVSYTIALHSPVSHELQKQPEVKRQNLKLKKGADPVTEIKSIHNTIR